ncbi:VOC family protein (plasmid) [Embleya sp. NBC_00888]|uniref:VOC family protein n=1 Tax=Embleya sp. NBC_00888 TaxID=2975960 RepID=UPI002F9132E9|nr:VOC family protein [Embleya sp. NBC_00888]
MSHDRKQEQQQQQRQEQDRDRLPVNTVLLNHTAVYAKDRRQAAEFLASILGLEVGTPLGPFLPVDLGNGVTLDYYEKNDEPIQSQHYAFLVPDDRFDAMIARLEALGVTYYADPGHSRPDETNDWFGGCGAYFEDPNGHNMEIMTRPYVRP